MTQYVYEIKGAPVAWCSHRGYGRKSFNPHYKEKEHAQWQLKIQHNGRALIKGAVCVDFFFEVPIPKSMEKKIRKAIDAGVQPYPQCSRVWCTKRPDCTNMRKHAEDCLTGTVLCDDNIVVAGETQKYYARGEPKTVIVIHEI